MEGVANFYLQDLRIGRCKHRKDFVDAGNLHSSLNFHSTRDLEYYEWYASVSYQAMAMAAIFTYVRIFHRVGDRRRIMQLRVRNGRPHAQSPPSDGQLPRDPLRCRMAWNLRTWLGLYLRRCRKHNESSLRFRERFPSPLRKCPENPKCW